MSEKRSFRDGEPKLPENFERVSLSKVKKYDYVIVYIVFPSDDLVFDSESEISGYALETTQIEGMVSAVTDEGKKNISITVVDNDGDERVLSKDKWNWNKIVIFRRKGKNKRPI